MPMLPFDDRDGFIWYDGRLVPWRDAKLHVLTHGLHYASCVFEGERVYNGKVFRLEDHNERLCNSAHILGFEVPASMDELAKATEELISAKLGHPTRDPHGDPIPTPDLRLDEPDTVALDSLGAGVRGTFVRVSDSDPEMLRYLADRGIAPGDRFEIVDKQPFDGPLFARFGSGADVHVLGGALAQAMRVEVTS